MKLRAREMTSSTTDAAEVRLGNCIGKANELLSRSQQSHDEIRRSIVDLIDEMQTARAEPGIESEALEWDSPIAAENISAEAVAAPRSTSPAPPRRRLWQPIWQFAGTDPINAGHWNTWVKQRQEIPGHARRRNIPGSIGRVFIHQKLDPPQLSEDGTSLYCESSLESRDRKGHNQFAVNHALLEKNSFLPLETEFRFEFDLKIESHEKDSGPSSPAHNVFQLWGPTYKPFGGVGNPPFGLFTYKGRWYVQSFGAPSPMPWAEVKSRFNASYSWGQIDNEWHHFDLRWKGSFTEGFYSVEMDGEVIKDTSSNPHPTALFHEEDLGPTMHLGTYAVRQEDPSACSFQDIKLSIRR